jgi:hypothetical protein
VPAVGYFAEILTLYCPFGFTLISAPSKERLREQRRLFEESRVLAHSRAEGLLL